MWPIPLPNPLCATSSVVRTRSPYKAVQRWSRRWSTTPVTKAKVIVIVVIRNEMATWLAPSGSPGRFRSEATCRLHEWNITKASPGRGPAFGTWFLSIAAAQFPMHVWLLELSILSRPTCSILQPCRRMPLPKLLPGRQLAPSNSGSRCERALLAFIPDMFDLVRDVCSRLNFCQSKGLVRIWRSSGLSICRIARPLSNAPKLSEYRS